MKQEFSPWRFPTESSEEDCNRKILLLLFFEETTDVVAGIQARAAGAKSPKTNMKSFVMPIDYFKGKEIEVI